jgi:predicted dithiol-disulfide oxidoreductase (DUF899 family)
VSHGDGPDGKLTLPDLFGSRSQLVVYHFMFPPEWDAGCPHCSFWADNFNGTPVHLSARDVSFTAISRAPIGKIIAYSQRMGWSFPWVSAGETDPPPAGPARWPFPGTRGPILTTGELLVPGR